MDEGDPLRQSLSTRHRKPVAGRIDRAGDADGDAGVEQCEQHQNPAGTPYPMGQNEGRIFGGTREGREMLCAPADLKAPGAKHVIDAEQHQRPQDSARDRLARVAGLFGHRGCPFPAREGEDRQHHRDIKTVSAGAAGWIEARNGNATRPGSRDAGDRQSQNDDHFSDGEDREHLAGNGNASKADVCNEY